MSFIYEYARPVVTVDVVAFRQGREGGEVLLIRRGQDPFKDAWALPGGHLEENEDLAVGAARELGEETGIKVRDDLQLVQIGTYGAPGRDPRGHYITVAYRFMVPSYYAAEPRAGDDAAEAKWFRLGQLPELAFDHAKIIADAGVC
jgi:8-oxo-dGTP diphosphatase